MYHTPSPFPFGLYLHVFFAFALYRFSNAASGTLSQNSQNSPIAYRHLNRPMNHWIDALSHFHHFL